MKNIKEKSIHFGILFGLIASVLLSFTDFNAKCDNLRENVLRLHVLANSDSKEDQALKLKVRDAILTECSSELSNCDSLEDAIDKSSCETQELKKIAEKVIKENGYDYKAEVSVGESYFDTRIYDSFTLPAGKYPALIVRLGKAKGHNWWCVVFPSVCIPSAAKGKLSDSASKSASEMAENPQKYVMKFKTVEWYEAIKKKIS